MFLTGGDPGSIVNNKGLQQITDAKQIEAMVEQVFLENPKQLEDYKAGKLKCMVSLLGK
jgi:aspartyl-tRNA(Asn)/glutamyl-tRNA(Gln) amidotransferase subunit B